jgi:K+-sensing histidine kinase KdpD
MLVSPTGRGMTNPFDSTTAQWAYDQTQQAGAGTNTLAGNEYLFLPLKTPTRVRGVLAVRPERPRDLFIPEQRHQYEVFATLVATALERVHYVEVARDALMMARLRSGEVELELQLRPLADVVDTSLEALGQAISRHVVRNKVARDLPPVPADPLMLERVFLALIGNVTKHTPAGTAVEVSAHVVGGDMEVVIEDEGPGLPPGREEEVFQSFTRGDLQMGKKGAGLGLAIARTIVEAHGGRIRAEKGRSKGARFVFTLPLRRG